MGGINKVKAKRGKDGGREKRERRELEEGSHPMLQPTSQNPRSATNKTSKCCVRAGQK